MRTADAFLITVLALAAGPACTVTQRPGTSPVQLVIASLEGGPGDDVSTFRHTFASDVLTNGRVIDDGGRVLLALILKDPGTADLPTRPAPANLVTISRYRVHFVRADGRSSPGVDVPYAFDGAVTFTVGPEGGVGRFVLVRAQSKLEPPLIMLRESGGSVALSTLAEVTFYGRDQAGHELNVVGLIGVNFADWADEVPTGT
jgi:hypothetical protein